MTEIKHRERTDKELEDMKKNLIGNTIIFCIYSDSEACGAYCVKFNDCWRIDYTSKLEKEIDKI